MQDASIRRCHNPECLVEDRWKTEEHRLFNLLLERLDEDHRRPNGPNGCSAARGNQLWRFHCGHLNWKSSTAGRLFDFISQY